ncbi:hypothetical protein SNEBB_001778 [Seison nebaliae]|nr:hypothetical protein SNEBB_001778 [Seison nebaliae]
MISFGLQLGKELPCLFDDFTNMEHSEYLWIDYPWNYDNIDASYFILSNIDEAMFLESNLVRGENIDNILVELNYLTLPQSPSKKDEIIFGISTNDFCTEYEDLSFEVHCTSLNKIDECHYIIPIHKNGGLNKIEFCFRMLIKPTTIPRIIHLKNIVGQYNFQLNSFQHTHRINNFSSPIIYNDETPCSLRSIPDESQRTSSIYNLSSVSENIFLNVDAEQHLHVYCSHLGDIFQLEYLGQYRDNYYFEINEKCRRDGIKLEFEIPLSDLKIIQLGKCEDKCSFRGYCSLTNQCICDNLFEGHSCNSYNTQLAEEYQSSSENGTDLIVTDNSQYIFVNVGDSMKSSIDNFTNLNYRFFYHQKMNHIDELKLIKGLDFDVLFDNYPSFQLMIRNVVQHFYHIEFNDAFHSLQLFTQYRSLIFHGNDNQTSYEFNECFRIRNDDNDLYLIMQIISNSSINIDLEIENFIPIDEYDIIGRNRIYVQQMKNDSNDICIDLQIYPTQFQQFISLNISFEFQKTSDIWKKFLFADISQCLLKERNRLIVECIISSKNNHYLMTEMLNDVNKNYSVKLLSDNDEIVNYSLIVKSTKEIDLFTNLSYRTFIK